MIGKLWRLGGVLLVLLALAATARAAECTDVYSSATGINANLASGGDTLELSGVPWASTAWPASGSTLTAGDYYFRGETLGNNYQLNVQSGAQVRIFVNDALSVGNNVRINASGEPKQLLLVTRGTLSIGNGVRLNGLVYASGSLGVGNNGQIEGGLAAEGALSLGNNSSVAQDYQGIDEGLLAGLCGTPVVLSANGESVGPVSVALGATVSFSGEVRDCPSDPSVFNTRQWRESWRLDGATVQQTLSEDSSCDRSPLTYSDAFDSPGSYVMALSVEYRDCFFWGIWCGSWQTHGSDDIALEVVDENPLTCFADAFANTALSGEDWVTSVSSGRFTPSVVNGRLRMTEAVTNQATAATLQREIPGADNLVILEFDYYAYGGNGADGVAVVLSDSAITPRPGSYGGSLGYAQRSNGDQGFAGGWIGIGLDEYGNFSNPTEGRIGGPGFRRDAVAIRGAVASGYRYLRGTSTLSPGIDQTGSNPQPHRYRIVVDSRSAGQALVSVERDVTGTGNSYQTLIAPFNALAETGQPDVPDNFLLSLTGSTGGSTNIHELDDVQLCALRLNEVGEQVDHFEIIHDGVALTCQPETVTLKACANADCTQLFTDPVVATLAPVSGWQGGNAVTLTNGTGQATLSHTTQGTVTLDVTGSVPSTRPQSQTLCQVAGSVSSSLCGLTFHESGLAFDVPDLTAHKPSGPVSVQAVRQDDLTQACVPAFENVSRAVDVWASYDNPTSGTRAPSVDGTEVSMNAASPTPVTLNFGANGVAQIQVTYPDAGLVSLGMRYSGTTSTGDDGLVMLGADSFVSVPAGFCVRTGGECDAADASCSAFRRAGEPFPLSIQAVGWEQAGDTDVCQGNPSTPNFQNDNMPLAIELVAPAGGELGTLSPAQYDHVLSSDAITSASVSVSEVGIFRFLVQPTAGSYLGRDLPSAQSRPTGRFYPDHFAVSIDPGTLAASCDGGGFTYLGEPFGWSLPPVLEIEPRSTGGSRTENYTHAGFRKLTEAGVERSAPVSDALATLSDGSLVPLETTVSSGVLSVVEPGLLAYRYSGDDAFTYLKDATSPTDPFAPSLQFSVDRIEDADGVVSQSAPHTFTPAADFENRYGRLVMENVYGPETLPALTLPFRVEYWSGSAFVTHSDDVCSAWNTADILDTAAHHTLSPDNGLFATGIGGPLQLVPNGTRGTDTLTWQVPEWLRHDDDGDGSLDLPQATATFGVYRGHDRVIYWHER
ncbi:DUF6701 domain-containing protein [Marinobacter lutaoensis]|uniref:DUF6701 domain-containing protein n=1 Tax=Marinobacter lutaoensis TaxID=135739 RepID=UPI0015936B05|nr:DUF6701 domain-containing protein [Marinobacter lutaoensis]NVD36769.1 MshQ-like protein [Marinobacter lutaoensis]